MRFRVTRITKAYVEVEAANVTEAFSDGNDRLSYGYSDESVVTEIEKIGP